MKQYCFICGSRTAVDDMWLDDGRARVRVFLRSE